MLLVEVDPPIDSLGIRTNKAIIATQAVGRSLCPITKWPEYVYVNAVCVDNVEIQDIIQPGNTKQVDWAALLPTEDEAKAFMIRPT